MEIKDFILINAEKVDRAINGTVTSNGQLEGGVGKKASDEEILAEYDRLGGCIMKKDEFGDNIKIATGVFYDFEKKQPRKEIKLEKAKEPSKGGIKTQKVGKHDVDKPKRKKVVDEDEE